MIKLAKHTKLLLGDEAVAQAAIDAGILVSYSYPGTPATEINEYIQNEAKNLQIHSNWAVNEKVAYEEALGSSWVGGRALISMKHVGLNVAADPFITSSLVKINGGLVLAVTDDPGMHSSQNEQDSRFYSDFAREFCFEPSNQQEAYNMTRESFELSEKHNVPIMIRLVTGISHTRANVKLSKPSPRKKLNPSLRPKDWCVLPTYAKQLNKIQLNKQRILLKISETSKYNKLFIGGNDVGIIASGVAFQYLMENIENTKNISYLKIGAYPLPIKKIQKLANHVKELIVLEDGYPYIESKICGLFSQKIIKGKLDGTLPIDGELTPDIVKPILGINHQNKFSENRSLSNHRLPKFCIGCPHIDTFNIIKHIRKMYPEIPYFGDIGCYTLEFLSPHKGIDTCLNMGASIGMAKGAVNSGLKKAIAIIGDSTFIHSGIPSLLEAAEENTNLTVFILDNNAVAMTGGQKVTGGKNISKIMLGIGVPINHIKEIIPIPSNLKKNIEIAKKEILYDGLSVIISKRECILTAKKSSGKDK
jgi:indolepyruvate ferredoxin oxidoreductase alpha subunit